MYPDTKKQKRAFTKQVISELESRLSAGQAKLAIRYAKQCLRRLPLEELESEAPSSLAMIILRQLEFLSSRNPGEMLIRVFNPSVEVDGWESSHTIIEIVNDDMPFLVDTAALSLSEMGLSIHLIIHPIVRVGRDGKGNLTGIHKLNTRSGKPESVIQFQVDRRADRDVLDEIRSRLIVAFGDLHKAVGDWKAMESRTLDTENEMPAWAPHVDGKWMKECQSFMHWLLDDHFIFLGVRDYQLRKGKKGFELQLVPGSGLGILREDENSVTTRLLTSLAAEVRKRSRKLPLIITKSNARSTVHRAGYLDYIGVLQFDKKGKTIGERRFLGLFTSIAYNLHAMETPLVRIRAGKALKNSGFVEGSHAWKSMLHILESLPRDELLQASSSELHELAVGVLNLQERQRVRLFIRRERYGRFYSCLVFIPREYFNTENREAIQKVLKRALKGIRLDYAVHISESSLARLHVVVRTPPDSNISYDVRALEQKIIEAIRSWEDELESVLVRKLGEEEGLRLASRFVKSFPEAYKEDVSPWVSGFDVENMAAVDEGEPLRMSLYRPHKKKGGIIRFKLFRQDSPIPLSNVLPMLENLGLHIVNERPYELLLDDDKRLWIQDFDMIPAVNRQLDLEVIRRPFLDAFRKTVAVVAVVHALCHLVPLGCERGDKRVAAYDLGPHVRHAIVNNRHATSQRIGARLHVAVLLFQASQRGALDVCLPRDAFKFDAELPQCARLTRCKGTSETRDLILAVANRGAGLGRSDSNVCELVLGEFEPCLRNPVTRTHQVDLRNEPVGSLRSLVDAASQAVHNPGLALDLVCRFPHGRC